MNTSCPTAVPPEQPVTPNPQEANSIRPARGSANAARIDSQELLGDAGKIHIEHNGEIYCLQRTRLGKLILTKQ